MSSKHASKIGNTVLAVTRVNDWHRHRGPPLLAIASIRRLRLETPAGSAAMSRCATVHDTDHGGMQEGCETRLRLKNLNFEAWARILQVPRYIIGCILVGLTSNSYAC